MSADPYRNSAGVGSPGSWNRYSYVQGDPVNNTDHTGTQVDGETAGVCGYDALSPLCDANDGSGIGGNRCELDGVGTDCTFVSALALAGALTVKTPFALGLSQNIPCEQGAVRSTILADAGNLGLNFSGYNLAGATAAVAGLTGVSMTELYVDVANGVDPQKAFGDLVKSLSGNFQYAGADPLHGDYGLSYRQTTATWSMQISYNNTTKQLQIDIDPHNPMFNPFGHAMDVLWNSYSGGDTNYHTAASSLGIAATPCP